MKPSKFAIEFAPEVIDHLKVIPRQQHGMLRAAIHEHLSFTPLEQTRNRKPLETPAIFAATWELRCGPRNRFRVFYAVNELIGRVEVLAIGIKRGSRLMVGDEEFET